ncbi:endonuclease/exonuclease/phosphatase family protein [Rhodovulum sp.]|uniref:endonuclease/exonuclease/phosphatase family protein n=1 Tax=Rhodovulum sp. TaxID=34009 RepID=UPI0017C7F63E|nr:endonuclease/exonuclease/phosphatase family protein [Rhodovulum sp.]HDR27729.1 endonuclease [Rhodovulum sp.]
MRIATYNVEWFNALFDDLGSLLDDDQPSARTGVTRHQQIEALGIVFTALDADAVLVVEAPDDTGRRSTVTALENFAQVMGLRARRVLIGFTSESQQEIALLYDPDRISAHHDPRGDPTGKKGSAEAPRFDGVFRWDLDVDAAAELIRFSKPPLELAVRSAAGFAFRMIGVHVKSKAPYGASTPDKVMRISIQNRRKQLAQCIWLRQRIEAHLAEGESLIVLGDFNDGPGLDEYEKLFGRSGVEIVMGLDVPREMRLYDPHARQAQQGRSAAQPATARFYIHSERHYLSALLDYVMISSDLRARRPAWRIWHPFDDPDLYRVPELREALLAASDHFPVSLDIEL